MNINEVEQELLDIWRRETSSPFIGQIPVSDGRTNELLDFLRNSLNGENHAVKSYFNDYPVFMTWGTLQAILKFYQLSDRYVYSPIENTLGIQVSTANQRINFKNAYVSAIQKLGINLADDSEPTSLFFSALGVPNDALSELAEIFLRQASREGLPAYEDLTSRRAWQQHAIQNRFQNKPRVLTPLRQDHTAYYSELFILWRADEIAPNPSAMQFFIELDKKSEDLSISKKILLNLPKLVWSNRGLEILNETSLEFQTINFGNVEHRLQIGQSVPIPEPWPIEGNWKCGNQTYKIPISPTEVDCLVFEISTGKMVARCAGNSNVLECAPDNYLILMANEFSVTGTESADVIKYCEKYISIIEMKRKCIDIKIERLNILSIIPPITEQDPHINAPVIGRCGSRPLYSTNGIIEFNTVFNELHTTRLVRIQIEDNFSFYEILIDEKGRGKLPLLDTILKERSDPTYVRVSLLEPGMEATPSSRATTTKRVLFWPGTNDYIGDELFQISHIPTNIVRERTKGCEVTPKSIWLNPIAHHPEAILSFTIDSQLRDFVIRQKDTRIYHYNLGKKQFNFLPAESTFFLNNRIRNDSIVIQSTEKNAKLVVCGYTINHPFHVNDRYNIHLSKLLEKPLQNTQVVMRFPDGRQSVLLNFKLAPFPGEIVVNHVNEGIVFNIDIDESTDFVGVQVEDESGEVEISSVNVSHKPSDYPKADYLHFDHRLSENEVQLTVRTEGIDWAQGAVLVRPLYQSSRDAKMSFISNRVGHITAGIIILPSNENTSKHLERVARWYSTPWSSNVQFELQHRLGIRFDQLLEETRRDTMLRPLLPALSATPLEPSNVSMNFVSRNEIFRIEPHLFERPLNDLLHLNGPLKALVRYIRFPHVEYNGNYEEWLEGILEIEKKNSEVENEISVLNANELRNCFRLFRTHFSKLDCRYLLFESGDSKDIKSILETRIDEEKLLGNFDVDRRADQNGIKIAHFLHNLARAARNHQTRGFHNKLAMRVGVSLETAEKLSSHLVHIAPELFGYFLALENCTNCDSDVN